MRYNRLDLFGCFLLLLLVLIGCGGQTETVPTGQPTAQLPTPTLATTISTTDLSTTATLPPPPAVATTIPTVAAAETVPGETAPGETAPTPTIAGLIGPNFPADINPLTGLRVDDPSVLNRRPLAVKISNYPAVVRPQSGLNSADLVFEHYAEGGVTRFTAVFYGRDATQIGSIRSARLLDFEIPQMYDAAFAYSGSSGPLRERFRVSSFFSRIISPDFGHGGFFRIEDPDRAFEHTLFTDTGSLRTILDQRGENRPPAFHSHMLFSPAPLREGTAANSLEIQYSGTNVFWQYNTATGRYNRWTDGVAHVDAASGEQLNFKNVILLGAHHEDTDILEDLVAGGHYSIEIQAWGEGPVSIFRDGQRFDGRWRREQPHEMLTFYELDGTPLPLAPGNSFFQVVPLGFTGLTVMP